MRLTDYDGTMGAKPGRGRSKLPEAASRIAIPAALPLTVAIAFATLSATQPIGDNDYGFHLRLGAEIAQSGPPATDSHSYTAPGAPYPDHEWLSQLLWFSVHRVVGDAGMVAFQATLVGVALTLVAASVRGGIATRVLALDFAFLLSLHHIQMRPHLLSWVFAALLMVLLGRRAHWAVPPLLVVWANCHASVPLAVLMACLDLAEEFVRSRRRRWLVLAAACVLTPLLNPYGIDVYTLFFAIRGHTDFIGEWKPYAPTTGPYWLLVLLFVLAAVGIARSRRRSPFDVVRVGLLVVLAFSSSRHGVVAAIYLAPLLGRWFAVTPAVAPRTSAPGSARLLACALAAVPIAVFAVLLSRGGALAFRLDHQRLPIEALAFLERHALEGPLFNDYNFGGWLLWRGWPRYPVFIDGRTEVYKGGILREYLAVSRAAPGFRATLDRYEVQTILVRPERELARALLRDADFELVYFDYNSVVLARRGSSGAVRRLEVVSPWGHRDAARRALALEEITYLVSENPRFFGGHKIRAFLLAKQGDFVGARDALRRYLVLHPAGRDVKDTRELTARLVREGLPP